MSAEDPLARYVREHAQRALSGLESIARDADVESVHHTRTSLRRLRATVRTFARSFPEPGALDEDLRFVALALGRIRDADVLASSLLPELEALPDELVLGPARRDLAEALSARRREGLDALSAACEDPRWGLATEQLTAWCSDPPALTGQDVAKTLKKSRRRVRRRIRSSEGHPVALHSARKAAKRWRYAAELLADAEPAAATHLERATTVQQVLGDLQDAVVACEFLREHAALGARSGHNAFTTGLLYASARGRVEDATARALDLV
ncbi:CHAD domain-containing protein [Brachybacterium sp. GCM10030268]|uniref:CHAD domain-containing protein n=1 Tax=Brachybacterium sp. GCM10030268 TaxID=3273382 RepID=UPI00360F0FCB